VSEKTPKTMEEWHTKWPGATAVDSPEAHAEAAILRQTDKVFQKRVDTWEKKKAFVKALIQYDLTDEVFLARLKRFRLLRDRLAWDPVVAQALEGATTHATTYSLLRFVTQHHFGLDVDSSGPIDIFDLWRRLDIEGRTELILYLQEEL